MRLTGIGRKRDQIKRFLDHLTMASDLPSQQVSCCVSRICLPCLAGKYGKIYRGAAGPGGGGEGVRARGLMSRERITCTQPADFRRHRVAASRCRCPPGSFVKLLTNPLVKWSLDCNNSSRPRGGF